MVLQSGFAEPQIDLGQGRARAGMRDGGHEADGVSAVPPPPCMLAVQCARAGMRAAGHEADGVSDIPPLHACLLFSVQR